MPRPIAYHSSVIRDSLSIGAARVTDPRLQLGGGVGNYASVRIRPRITDELFPRTINRSLCCFIASSSRYKRDVPFVCSY